MCIAIKTKSGNCWYTDGDDVKDVRQRIEMGESIRVWWFSGWGQGQRFTETLWLAPDEISHLITESDDG